MRFVLGAIAFVTMLLPCQAAEKAGVEPVLKGKDVYRVLVVGNSHTQHRGVLLADLLGELSRGPGSPVRIEAQAKAASNETLQGHWRGGESRVKKGNFDAVVLQEHSQRPLTDFESTLTYARKFQEVAAENGGKVVLWMMWSKKNDPELTAKQSEISAKLAKELGAPVAPIGLAWQTALREKPDLALYKPEDMHHAAPLGFYLNACVIYATLTGYSPVGLGDGGIEAATPEVRKFLQDVAWRTVKAYTQPAAGAKP
jgi:hypothetical protein